MRWGALLGVAPLVGCLSSNPDWDAGEDERESTSGTSSTSAGAAASSPPATTDDSSTSTSSSSSSGESSGGETEVSTTGPGLVKMEKSFQASIAECLGPALARDQCEASTEEGAMTVDGGPEVHLRRGYIRFDYELPAGAMVEEARLRLTVPPRELCAGERSGELWEVDKFDLSDIAGEGPAFVQRLSEGLGPVETNEKIVFEVPIDALGDDAVFFALEPTTANEVCYWNTRGETPPELGLKFAAPP